MEISNKPGIWSSVSKDAYIKKNFGPKDYQGREKLSGDILNIDQALEKIVVSKLRLDVLHRKRNKN
ncbi:MAG: hypothetical protein U9N77_10325 [Thermodesulfobacteriota bacterium]|nr:hypothetical protein [Thermodesulfobacteriota bacterium]